ncbi:MAG: ABC transporter permease [Bacteroidales bacterium]|nr:ABC transporter permease [Bacteroidales bacterium]
MNTLKLAYRNLVGAGLRTWLNVIVLSFSFVLIIWHKGILDGWNAQAQTDMIGWEIAGGQYWHEKLDPYDPFTLDESHGKLSDEIIQAVEDSLLSPILLAQGTIYPEGRIQSIMIKGIDPGQTLVKLSSHMLKTEMDELPAIIGTRMAASNKLKLGDYVTIRWRDVNGTFDAAEIKIVGLFKTTVSTVDNGQIWVPLERLQHMLQIPGEASILMVRAGEEGTAELDGWKVRDLDYLLKDFKDIIASKSIGGSVLYIVVLMLALLAIFDTQVLSVFRRQKEIGTYMALGMTRGQVIRMFTVEGAMHGVLAAIVAAIYGIPLLSIQAVKGWSMPMNTDDYGLAIADKIFPMYSGGLVAGTILIVLITTTIVSYIPVRKIAKMKPTDAIKGKLQ